MRMIEKVMAELQKQGFVPQREDDCVVFKYQMLGYLYLDDEDEDYFSLYAPYIFEVGEDNLGDVYAAINAINKDMKVVKLMISDDHVWACFEEMLPHGADLGEILPYAIASLFRSRQQFYEKLKEV